MTGSILLRRPAAAQLAPARKLGKRINAAWGHRCQGICITRVLAGWTKTHQAVEGKEHCNIQKQWSEHLHTSETLMGHMTGCAAARNSVGHDIASTQNGGSHLPIPWCIPQSRVLYDASLYKAEQCAKDAQKC